MIARSGQRSSVIRSARDAMLESHQLGTCSWVRSPVRSLVISRSEFREAIASWQRWKWESSRHSTSRSRQFWIN
jgi:hypothetical protein